MYLYIYIYHVRRVSPRGAGSGGRKQLSTQKHACVSHTLQQRDPLTMAAAIPTYPTHPQIKKKELFPFKERTTQSFLPLCQEDEKPQAHPPGKAACRRDQFSSQQRRHALSFIPRLELHVPAPRKYCRQPGTQRVVRMEDSHRPWVPLRQPVGRGFW